MKVVSLFIALCFSMNILASTDSIKAFEALLDDYHYTMSVDWDQKDQVFQTEKTKEFVTKMQIMISNSSLTQKDVITVVEKKINDKNLVDALRLKMIIAGDMNSTEELIKFMNQSSNDFYSHGASWNGRVVIPLAIFTVAVTALGFAMWYSATHGCKEYAQTCDQFGCRNNYNVCVDHGYVGPHL